MCLHHFHPSTILLSSQQSPLKFMFPSYEDRTLDEETRSFVFFLLLLCEGTRLCLSANQQKDPHLIMDLLVLWSWTSQPLQLWAINVCCASQPVAGTLLTQHKWKNTIHIKGHSKVSRNEAVSTMHKFFSHCVQWKTWAEESVETAGLIPCL